MSDLDETIVRGLRYGPVRLATLVVLYLFTTLQFI